MHQPKVDRRRPPLARLLSLLVAVFLVVPVLAFARSAVVSAAFVAEFLTDGAVTALSRLSERPRRADANLPGASADAYTLSVRDHRTPLVLVHGLSPDGKDDPRLVRAANLLARVGFEVTVPTIPGLTRWRLRPEDRQPVVTILSTRAAPAVVVGVSVGAGVALLAAAEPAVRDHVRLVLSLGGYASARQLVRFYLTGDYAYDGARGHARHDPELVRAFLTANADLLDPSAQRLLGSSDPAAFTTALDALSPGLARLLDALSPERVARDITARLVLVHGRNDIAVPYSETLRLAAARPEKTRVVLVGVVGHVEHASGALEWRQVVDLIRLWTAMYTLTASA